MTGVPPDEKPLKIQGLLGLGLDDSSGHTRVTRGPRFYLYGGSRDTHERMVQTAVKFNEKVDERGKSLPEINARDLSEISRELQEEL